MIEHLKANKDKLRDTTYSILGLVLMQAAAHDKKYSGNTVTVVTVLTVGSYALEKWTPAQLTARMEAYYG